MVKSMLVFRLLICTAILPLVINILFSQSFNIKGQFWGSKITGDDAYLENSFFESSLGYIPTFSLYEELDDNQMLDMEFSYRINYLFFENTLIREHEKLHRFWVRYSNNELEARIGLQKIVFGPSQILRSLSWFDTIDLKDPTNQTEGVEAFRLRWFPSNSSALWLWLIMNEQNKFSQGGRGEFSSSIGEWGFTFHVDPSNNHDNHRMALDYRHDGLIGFWNENSKIKYNGLRTDMITVGADYTLPFINGILIMTESMFMSIEDNLTSSNQYLSAFMSSLPIGMFHHFMVIFNLDWENNQSSNYLRWSSTYDSYSLNCMVSINPIEDGNSLQFMLIYNH